MIQRIIYLNKVGDRIDIVVDIIGRKSKKIIARRIGDDEIMTIPSKDIEQISEPVKEIEKI